MSDATNYIAGINAYISNAKSPLNALTMMPAEYAAIGQPTGPQPFTVEDLVSIATLVGGIFGNGGGQQLSNARPVREPRGEVRSRAATVAGSPELIAQPAKKKPKKHKGKPGKRKGKPKPTKPAVDAQAARASRRAPLVPDRRAGKAGSAPASCPRPLRLCHVPQLRRPVRPRGADDRPRQVVPVPDAAGAEQGRAADAGPARLRARSATSTRSTAGAVPRGRVGASATAGSKAGPATGGSNPSQGLLAVPAVDVQRAAGQRRRQRQRPSARGDGPAGQLLQPRRS